MLLCFDAKSLSRTEGCFHRSNERTRKALSCLLFGGAQIEISGPTLTLTLTLNERQKERHTRPGSRRMKERMKERKREKSVCSKEEGGIRGV